MSVATLSPAFIQVVLAQESGDRPDLWGSSEQVQGRRGPWKACPVSITQALESEAPSLEQWRRRCGSERPGWSCSAFPHRDQRLANDRFLDLTEKHAHNRSQLGRSP